MLKNKKGVTYIELLMTVLAVIVLSVLSFRLYGYHIEKSVAVEGAQLLRKIADAEIVNRLEYKNWVNFENLVMTIDGELLNANTIKKENFIYSIAGDFGNAGTIQISATRYYTEEDNTKNYRITATLSPQLTSENYFNIEAVGGNTAKEKAVVAYINKRFGR